MHLHLHLNFSMKPIAIISIAALSCLASSGMAQNTLGRAATPAEIAAWNIDVRPDFAGLPPGSGSVAQGLQVWEGKCARCHGSFGESVQFTNALAGGTTAQDLTTGRVAGLAWLNPQTPPLPATTLMKVATVSTLWDYIRRAMPYDQPKTLSVNEVYASLAYMLSLADVVPQDFVLTERNIAQVKLPNRLGMRTDHGLWRVDGTPDVQGTLCMNNCDTPSALKTLPARAKFQQGNVAEQMRSYGPLRGVDTPAQLK